MTAYGLASRCRAAYPIKSHFHPKAGVIREEKLRNCNESLPPVDDGRGRQETQQAVSNASSDFDVVIIRI
jgi:hypothetical protein